MNTGGIMKEFKVGDRVKPIKDILISIKGKKSIKLFTNYKYKIIEVKAKTITLQVHGTTHVSFYKDAASVVFNIIPSPTFKWTNIYTNNGFLKTTLLWDTKEKAQAEYDDMKDIYPDVKLTRIQY